MALDPVTVFIGGYIGGKLIDEVFDPATGKPNTRLLDQRLRELEVSTALRSDIQSKIQELRLRVDASVTRAEFEQLTKQLARDVESVQARLNSLEERVELLEVELEDSKNWSKNARNSMHFFQRAKVFFEKQEFHRAIANCNIALRLDPKNAKAYFRRGQAYYNLNAPPELVIIDHSESIRLAPKEAVTYFCRSCQFHRQNDFARAMADASEAVRLDPKDPDYIAQRGFLKLSAADFEAAAKDYSTAIGLSSSNADYLAYRGWAYVYSNQLDKASSDIEKAIELAPNSSTGYLARSQLLLAKSENQGVIRDATKCIELGDKSGFAIRGCAHAKLKDFQAAFSDLTEAVRFNPSDASSAKNLKAVQEAIAPTRPTGLQLPIEGTWEFIITGNDAKFDAVVSNGTLEVKGTKVKWERIRLLPNGRYAAVRSEPGVFSPYESNVELYVDSDGVLRQDDSNLPVLWRSMGSFKFLKKSLLFEDSFAEQHLR